MEAEATPEAAGGGVLDEQPVAVSSTRVRQFSSTESGRESGAMVIFIFPKYPRMAGNLVLL